jgi:hypothetical protein
MTSPTPRISRRVRREAPAHMFELGQAVRLKGGFALSASRSEDIFHITGMLPPKEDSPQYRIRNQDERHERVTTQDNLEAVDISPSTDGATLIERTFGDGQGTEAQQPRNPKAQTAKGAA